MDALHIPCEPRRLGMFETGLGRRCCCSSPLDFTKRDGPLPLLLSTGICTLHSMAQLFCAPRMFKRFDPVQKVMNQWSMDLCWVAGADGQGQGLPRLCSPCSRAEGTRRACVFRNEWVLVMSQEVGSTRQNSAVACCKACCTCSCWQQCGGHGPSRVTTSSWSGCFRWSDQGLGERITNGQCVCRVCSPSLEPRCVLGRP